MSENMNMNIKIGEFNFLQMPKVVWEDRNLSALAKTLYMAMFDRQKMSRKYGWYDDNLDVYIYFKIEGISEILGIGEKKAQQLKKELRDRGLIVEVRQGLNKPNKIYLRKFDSVYSKEEILKASLEDE